VFTTQQRTVLETVLPLLLQNNLLDRFTFAAHLDNAMSSTMFPRDRGRPIMWFNNPKPTQALLRFHHTEDVADVVARGDSSVRLLFEHVVPKSVLFRLYLDGAQTLEEILNLYTVCVVLKAEDRAIRWTCKMPDGWRPGASRWSRYEQTMIEGRSLFDRVRPPAGGQ